MFRKCVVHVCTSNINRLTVLANMGKVQVIGLEKAAGELSEVSAALRAVMEGR